MSQVPYSPAIVTVLAEKILSSVLDEKVSKKYKTQSMK